MNKILLPVYKAKRAPDSAEIIGYPVSRTHMYVPDSFDEDRWGTFGNGFESYYLDSLMISFDEKTWESIKDVEELLEYGKTYKQQDCL